MNNPTTAHLPRRFNEHSGILAAKILGAPYVGQNVDTINELPQPIHIPPYTPIRL